MIAIVTLFLISCIGWFILGSVTAFRSNDSFSRLGSQVEALWGTPLIQKAPAFSVQIPGSRQVRWIMPSRNQIDVEIQPEYRKKGPIWYPTYTCSFEGNFTVANTEDVLQKIRLHFAFPVSHNHYSGDFDQNHNPLTENREATAKHYQNLFLVKHGFFGVDKAFLPVSHFITVFVILNGAPWINITLLQVTPIFPV